MRLTPEQTQAILAAARELAGPRVQVRLFGSRTNDEIKGGDIDLLIESPDPVSRPVWLVCQVEARLQRVLGERRIDVLLTAPNLPLDPIHHEAQLQGLVLLA